jgi:8-amino-7-oxononanoate synthase
VRALGEALWELREEEERGGGALGEGSGGCSRSVFVAVESVYSMDGSVAPLRAMLDVMDEVFPARNAHLVVDEAHATGIYGPSGRGMVAQLGLEDRVLARLHTFGKALAASGGTSATLCVCLKNEPLVVDAPTHPSPLSLSAVILTSTLIRDYLLNYARPLIYTTALSNAAIIAASCSFDLLEDGTAEKVLPFLSSRPLSPSGGIAA